MLTDFNILATTSRGNEHDACEEIQYLLGEVGDPSATVRRSRISGIVVARTSLNPLVAIEELGKILRDRPYEFRYTLRMMPIETIVRTDVEEIKNRANELASRIGGDESFRITVEKRFTSLGSREIIDVVAKEIKKRVDLTKPDRVLLIEIVGGLTGISLIKPEYIVSVLKEKMR